MLSAAGCGDAPRRRRGGPPASRTEDDMLRGGRTPAVGLVLVLLGVLAFVWLDWLSPSRHQNLVGGKVAGQQWRVEAWRDPGRRTVCAELFLRYHTHDGWQWSGTGRSTEACAWPKTTDGSGWVRDGGAQEVASTGEWVFFGVVPDQAMTVRLTLEAKGTRQVASFAHKGLPGRFYVIQQRGFHPANVNDLFQARLVALDAAGRPLHVY
jgi:hypothetical protein